MIMLNHKTLIKLNIIKYFVEGKYKFFPLNRYIKYTSNKN